MERQGRKKREIDGKSNARMWSLGQNWEVGALERFTREPSEIPDRFSDLML